MACHRLHFTFIKRHVMQTYGDVEIQLHVFWTLPVSGQGHNPAALPLALRAQESNAGFPIFLHAA